MQLLIDPMPKYKTSPGQIVLFPSGDTLVEEQPVRLVSPAAIHSDVQPKNSLSPRLPVVLSGSYRKDFEGLRRAYEELLDLGCDILSPSNVLAVNEVDGFVYMKGEEVQNPDAIEARHLDSIQRSSFVWLHAPDGYVGPTAALEIGFARAVGVPVYGRQAPKDKILRSFVRVVGSPVLAIETRTKGTEPPTPALKAFQEYYRRAAMERGYGKEGAKECLLLMVEEVGELARALRKRENLTRHGSYGTSNEAHELADVFLYVVHMANVLGLDLGDVVREKEFINVEKFLAR